jgi:hypothetical protein
MNSTLLVLGQAETFWTDLDKSNKVIFVNQWQIVSIERIRGCPKSQKMSLRGAQRRSNLPILGTNQEIASLLRTARCHSGGIFLEIELVLALKKIPTE